MHSLAEGARTAYPLYMSDSLKCLAQIPIFTWLVPALHVASVDNRLNHILRYCSVLLKGAVKVHVLRKIQLMFQINTEGLETND